MSQLHLLLHKHNIPWHRIRPYSCTEWISKWKAQHIYKAIESWPKYASNGLLQNKWVHLNNALWDCILLLGLASGSIICLELYCLMSGLLIVLDLEGVTFPSCTTDRDHHSFVRIMAKIKFLVWRRNLLSEYYWAHIANN